MTFNITLEKLITKSKKDNISFNEWYQALEYLDLKYNFHFVGAEKYFNYRKHFDNNHSPEETINVVFDYFAFKNNWGECLDTVLKSEYGNNVHFLHSARW